MLPASNEKHNCHVVSEIPSWCFLKYDLGLLKQIFAKHRSMAAY